MPKFNDILFNVYATDSEKGARILGEGLPAKKAIALAKRVFRESRWSVDTQIVPVSAWLFRDASLQKKRRKPTAKKPSKNYSFSSS
jgi:hypothetical protein